MRVEEEEENGRLVGHKVALGYLIRNSFCIILPPHRKGRETKYANSRRNPQNVRGSRNNTAAEMLLFVRYMVNGNY